MTYLNTHARSTKPTKSDLFQPIGRVNAYTGLYLGFVKDAADVQKNGRLRVWVPELGSEPENPDGWVTASYCSPFAGATNIDSASQTDYESFDKTQTSYGFWMIPPDINNEVLVMFINGKTNQAVWIGCFYNQFTNNMVPGSSASKNNFQYPEKYIPVSEYNKWDAGATNPDKNRKPYQKTKFLGLGNQGLINDRARGVTSSSARREAPSNVYGIITPGPPIDKDASPENIRRKGGSSLIMDDGDGTEYVQLTTKTGAQVRLDETHGFVYLINRDGTAWVQMDKDGNVDIFGAKNVSMRAQRDINIRADRNVNIEAGQNVFIKAAQDTEESVTEFEYDVNNVPQPKTIPYWKYVGEGNGQGGNIVMQALNEWHSTTKMNAYLTVTENNMNIGIKNSLNVTTDKGGQDYSSKMGIKITTDAALDILAKTSIRAGANEKISMTAENDMSFCSSQKLSLNGDLGVAISSIAEIGVTGDTRFGNSVGIIGLFKAGGNAEIGENVSLGIPVVVDAPLEPSSPEAAVSATSAQTAEVKAMVDKINILATWDNAVTEANKNFPIWVGDIPYKKDDIVIYNNIIYKALSDVPATPVFINSYWSVYSTKTYSGDKFKRNAESMFTTVTRLPTYEPCPEHEQFSFSNIANYKPVLTNADKTYEGSGGSGNNPQYQPPTSTTPGANNTTIPPESPIDSSVAKDFNLTAFRCQLTIHEGNKNRSYLCSAGKLTGGIGHLLRDPNETQRFPLGTQISEEQIQRWYEEDSVTCIKGAQRLLGSSVWGNLSDIRKRACADLVYNLGEGGLSKFKVFLSAIKSSNWQEAGEALRNSSWYKQVGRRGPNIVTMIVQNVDPLGCDKK